VVTHDTKLWRSDFRRLLMIIQLGLPHQGLKLELNNKIKGEREDSQCSDNSLLSYLPPRIESGIFL